MDDLIGLVSMAYSRNEIGERVESETVTPVWAHIKSVNRTEWMEGGRLGLNPGLVFETPKVNYNGEKVVIYPYRPEEEPSSARRYAIYRTYSRDTDDAVELYAEIQTGVV